MTCVDIVLAASITDPAAHTHDIPDTGGTWATAVADTVIKTAGTCLGSFELWEKFAVVATPHVQLTADA